MSKIAELEQLTEKCQKVKNVKDIFSIILPILLTYDDLGHKLGIL